MKRLLLIAIVVLLALWAAGCEVVEANYVGHGPRFCPAPPPPVFRGPVYPPPGPPAVLVHPGPGYPPPAYYGAPRPRPRW